jgi:hypothetical protein
MGTDGIQRLFCDINSGFQEKKQELVRFLLKQFHNKFLNISGTKKLISFKNPRGDLT